MECIKYYTTGGKLNKSVEVGEEQSYVSRFNSLYAEYEVTKTQDLLIQMLDLLFEYYYIYLDYKNFWWTKITSFDVPLELRSLNDDDIYDIIVDIFCDKFLRYPYEYSYYFPEYNPFLYMSHIFDQHLHIDICYNAMKGSISKCAISGRSKINLNNFNIISSASVMSSVSFEIEDMCADNVILGEVIDWLQKSKGGHFVLCKYGIILNDKPMTVREICDRYNVSTKFVNYWLEKTISQAQRKFASCYAR